MQHARIKISIFMHWVAAFQEKVYPALDTVFRLSWLSQKLRFMMEKPKGRVQNSNTALGLSKVDFVEAQKMIF